MCFHLLSLFCGTLVYPLTGIRICGFRLVHGGRRRSSRSVGSNTFFKLGVEDLCARDEIFLYQLYGLFGRPRAFAAFLFANADELLGVFFGRLVGAQWAHWCFIDVLMGA